MMEIEEQTMTTAPYQWDFETPTPDLLRTPVLPQQFPVQESRVVEAPLPRFTFDDITGVANAYDGAPLFDLQWTQNQMENERVAKQADLFNHNNHFGYR